MDASLPKSSFWEKSMAQGTELIVSMEEGVIKVVTIWLLFNNKIALN